VIRGRFWAHVMVSDGCWLWAGSVDSCGYGRWGSRLAHRLVYEALVGPIEGMYVLHRCDVPRCVSPGHLFLGTQADNMADMKSKGRWRYGGGHPEPALDREGVERAKQLRAAGSSFREIGLALGCSATTAFRVVQGRRLYAGT